MNREQCFLIGKITKLHGYKGAVVLYLNTHSPEQLKQMESVFLDMNGELVPFFLEQIQSLNGQKMILSFEDVSPEQAAQLVGKEVLLSRAFMPEPADEEEVFEQELIGWTAIDELQGPLGTIEEILENTAQQLLLIDGGERGSILVPLVEAFFSKVDRPNKTLYLSLPEGLVDLNS